MTFKEQWNGEKTLSWGETVRKCSETKRTLENFKITGTTEKKSSPSNICLKNKNGLSFHSLSIAKTFK